MTSITGTWLFCDYPKCMLKFNAAPEQGWPPLSVVRREARKAGWTVSRSSVGRKFDKDYCPEHAEFGQITTTPPAG